MASPSATTTSSRTTQPSDMPPAPPSSRPALGAQRLGWHIVCHPSFTEPLLSLADAVHKLRRQGGAEWQSNPKAKLLKRVLEIILQEIPANPAPPQYEQGNTIDPDARGWRRAKFLGRFRLFYRFDIASRVIVYAWVNDENTLPKAGAASDPYAIFPKMLIDGNPPNGFDRLIDACRATTPTDVRRLADLLGPLSPFPAEQTTDKQRRPRR